MATNRGKSWEEHFKSDWQNSFPKTFILRLPDQMTGWKVTSANICDFIAFNKGKLYLLECKSHKENTIPFSDIPQYDRMLPYKGWEGIRAGIIVWAIDHQRVFYLPISTMEKMKEDGKKSFHFIKDLELFSPYKIYELPSVCKRVYPTVDYTVLLNLQEGE